MLSQKYLESSFTQPEWAAAFAQDPQGKKQKLIPVRIAPCELTGILAPIVYLDLVGLPEEDARAALLGAFSARNKPALPPAFPRQPTPHKPGVSLSPTRFPGIAKRLPLLSQRVCRAWRKTLIKSDRLSITQRLQLMRQLNEILPQHFNTLLFTVNPQPGLVPPMPAPKAIAPPPC